MFWYRLHYCTIDDNKMLGCCFHCSALVRITRIKQKCRTLETNPIAFPASFPRQFNLMLLAQQPFFYAEKSVDRTNAKKNVKKLDRQGSNLIGTSLKLYDLNFPSIPRDWFSLFELFSWFKNYFHLEVCEILFSYISHVLYLFPKLTPLCVQHRCN